MTDDRAPRIDISSIPVGRGIGAGLAILVLLTAMAIDISGIRWLAVWGTACGLALGGGLIGWRRRHQR